LNIFHIVALITRKPLGRGIAISQEIIENADLFLCIDDMLLLIENNIKNDICNNALVFVTLSYNERYLVSLKTNWHIHTICKK
jgi:hypothetical protein